MPKTQELVARGAEILDSSERALHQIEKDMTELGSLLGQAHQNGDIGFLLSKEFEATAKSIPINALRKIFDLHGKLTAIAQAKGMDLPQPRSGGGR